MDVDINIILCRNHMNELCNVIHHHHKYILYYSPNLNTYLLYLYLLYTIILIHNKSTTPNNFWKTPSLLQNTLRLKIWRNEICLISEGKLVFILCMIEKKMPVCLFGWPVWFQLNQLNLQYFTIIYNNFPYE